MRGSSRRSLQIDPRRARRCACWHRGPSEIRRGYVDMGRKQMWTRFEAGASVKEVARRGPWLLAAQGRGRTENNVSHACKEK
ncbi:hypothetical protein L1887_49893 [Cichorium endivia]|nr:hypothetical protein L1887_49893 [Cichorium endivia]